MTVKQIQCLLTYLGYSPGTIDGIDGRNTQGAIRAFQADYGLTVDGIPGAATQKMLIGAIAGTAVKVEKPESSTPQKTGAFWDGIKYFKREEFRCPCGKCGGFPVEPKEAPGIDSRAFQCPYYHRSAATGKRPFRRFWRAVSGIQRFVAGQREEFTACTGKGRRHHCQRFFWNLGQGLL